MNEETLAKKSLGQHWLNDQAALKEIVDTAKITDKDVVLEIGPGTGSLTSHLVKKAKNVIAVELDEQLANKLSAEQNGPNLQIIAGDILRFDLTTLPAGYKVVANIPYYLTSHLIRVLSETPNPPAMAVLLVQKEVAERVAAKPGKMSLLSASAQFYWNVTTGQIVPARLFTPPPKVDSQILIMNRRVEPLFDVDTKAFFRIIKAGFSNRRKTILNSLAGGLDQSKQAVLADLEAASISPKSRPQELSLPDWHKLYLRLGARK